MSWLLDLGNTRAKWARFDHGRRVDPVRGLAHADPGFIDALLAALASADPETVWLASVADSALTDFVQHRLSASGHRCERVRVHPETLGVRIAYADPTRLGVDRYLALLAAHARVDGPWLLVSVGSALTVDLLAIDGAHAGGLIAPSPGHMRQALAERFPALAVDGGDLGDWAADTGDALASGALAAAAGLVERAHRLARARLGVDPTVLVSGGGAAPVRAALPFASQFVEAPVLDGLARLAAQGAA
ncbi:MAG: type III pantothenate kinase [Arenimonas sp.]